MQAEHHKSERLLRLPAVLSRIPYKRSRFLALVREGVFPRPVKLGPRAVAWPESQIGRSGRSSGGGRWATMPNPQEQQNPAGGPGFAEKLSSGKDNPLVPQAMGQGQGESRPDRPA
jgi:predicted DNA-binding transcriptional regulator AlpA